MTLRKPNASRSLISTRRVWLDMDSKFNNQKYWKDWEEAICSFLVISVLHCIWERVHTPLLSGVHGNGNMYKLYSNLDKF
jgi:hypothetical protein